mmetsp:Transcript_24292/g.77974  ORF Transcript_24292/g.77974 Transcript_24292/m.77974 type:complete len:270 (+) Transcript_24292:1728-2537(+)
MYPVAEVPPAQSTGSAGENSIIITTMLTQMHPMMTLSRPREDASASHRRRHLGVVGGDAAGAAARVGRGATAASKPPSGSASASTGAPSAASPAGWPPPCAAAASASLAPASAMRFSSAMAKLSVRTTRKRFMMIIAPKRTVQTWNAMATPGMPSSLPPSQSEYITSTHPSSVMDWKMVTIDQPMLSKWLMPVFGLSSHAHAASSAAEPAQRHCCPGMHVQVISQLSYPRPFVRLPSEPHAPSSSPVRESHLHMASHTAPVATHSPPSR